MIISRTPLRISIGGGGSDLPSFYESHGGFFISAAIDKHIYISLNNHFGENYLIRYSDQEQVFTRDEIRHRIVRAAFEEHTIPPVELVSIADLPGGTGLGSSGTFTVGLLNAVYAQKRQSISTHALAEEACHVEMNLLGEPVGKQDQFIAAYGGITCFEIDKDGTVVAAPLLLSNRCLYTLEDRLLLFFTGHSRSASVLLGDQKAKSQSGDKSMTTALQATVELGREIQRCLIAGDAPRFGDLMHEHWERKRQRSQGMSNPLIDRCYAAARANGARGGKLVGAGGGGFLLFYADDPEGVRDAMTKEGLQEVRFRFDFDGSTIIHRG
jgi:D-glycero-alpha-D-manno-heptose-7-phosphate kinase